MFSHFRAFVSLQQGSVTIDAVNEARYLHVPQDHRQSDKPGSLSIGMHWQSSLAFPVSSMLRARL